MTDQTETKQVTWQDLEVAEKKYSFPTSVDEIEFQAPVDTIDNGCGCGGQCAPVETPLMPGLLYPLTAGRWDRLKAILGYEE